jgi:hypothetical protein
MAKALPPKAPATSRIRFVLVEAEIANASDLSQITQAIQNAVRPTIAQVRLNGPVSARTNGVETPAAEQPVVDVEGEEVAEEAVDTSHEQEARTATPRGPKKPPKVITLDLDGNPSFAQFAADKAPTSHFMRYLTVAAWFKLYKDTNAITASHVYTCYRHVDWPKDVDDWGQPLRDLKRQQFLGGENRGQYEINQLGMQRVEKLPKQ